MQPAAALPSAEYRPNLNVNDATVEAYDHHFEGTLGLRLKEEIEEAATRVGVDPGLLAAYLFAEQNNRDFWLRSSGTVRGYRVGIDSWNEYAEDIKSNVPAASDVTVTGQERNVTNEKRNTLSSVPIIRANDAIIASASYLKYAELRMAEFVEELAAPGNVCRLKSGSHCSLCGMPGAWRRP